MLINYSFSNFRSFENRTSLSMIAGKQRTFNENLIRKSGLRIIPSVVIYGANASGKSNIIMSLAVMREIILTGSIEASVQNLNNLELYPFAHSEVDKPMEFEIEFIYKEHHVIYKFELTLEKLIKGSRKIIREELSVVDKLSNRIKIYERNLNGIQIMKDKKALDIIEFNEKLLKEFEKRLMKILTALNCFYLEHLKAPLVMN